MAIDTAALVERSSDRLSWDDLDIAAFSDHPLDPDSLRCIRYMHDVEFHTACYLRDLLLTPAHADARMTAFLTMWAYQEYWHGEALSAVLAAHGEPHGEERVGAVRRALGVRDRIRPLVMALGGWVGGSDFIALQMTWGAVNEWTTQTGYAQLGRRADHPVLTALLKRVMRQEGRHIDFYMSEASDRLGSSRRARQLTRAALRRFWAPVGSGVMPNEEVGFLGRYLLGDEAGQVAARRIDRQIDRLPGLAGLHLVERATGGAGASRAPSSAGSACAA